MFLHFQQLKLQQNFHHQPRQLFFSSCELENSPVVAFVCLEVVLNLTPEWCIPKYLNLGYFPWMGLSLSLSPPLSRSLSQFKKNQKKVIFSVWLPSSEDLTSENMLNICGTLGKKKSQKESYLFCLVALKWRPYFWKCAKYMWHFRHERLGPHFLLIH